MRTTPGPIAGDGAATHLRRRLLSGLSAVDRRLRLRRALAALVWLAPAASLWLLSTWLLRLSAGTDSVAAALWPSWAGGAVLLALIVREAIALGRDLGAAARAVDKAGDLHDAVATALEMQSRLAAAPGGDREHEKTRGATVWPLPWITLVLKRAVDGLNRTGPRRAAPNLAPRGAVASAIVTAALLLPVALPTSAVGEALAAAMSGDLEGPGNPDLLAAGMLDEEPARRPGLPELQAMLSDLPFLTLRIREPGADEGARATSGEANESAEGSLGDQAEAEALEGTTDGAEGAAGSPGDEANAETGTELMRELDTGEGAGEEDLAAPGEPGSGEGAEAGAETAAGDGAGGQPTEDSEGSGNESGAAAAVSDEPGASSADADGGAAGAGTGPQDEMVDPFGDFLTPALSLEDALQTALLESLQEIERRPLTTTSATQFRAAEVAKNRPAPVANAGNDAAIAELPPPRQPIAWRHRDSVRRYLESLEDESQ